MVKSIRRIIHEKEKLEKQAIKNNVNNSKKEHLKNGTLNQNADNELVETFRLITY